MLTGWGFTTVWDLGSDPNNTMTIRRRVESGEFAGLKILMAGDIFPKNGHPVYLPAEMQLPEAATPQEAAQMARQYLEMGLDGIKLRSCGFLNWRDAKKSRRSFTRSGSSSIGIAAKFRTE